VRINRGLLFWGLALITAGATALLVQQGYIDRDWVTGAWRLWPLILVVIGLSIILARTPFAILGTILAALVLGFGVGAAVGVGPTVGCTGDLPTDLQQQDGTFSGGPANVTLDFNCGRMDVSMADGSDWQARTGVTGDRDVRVNSSANSLTIRSPEGGFNWNEGKQRWEVDLGSEPTYDMHVSANAADARFDLAGGTFSRLEVDPNAVSMRFDLSGASVDDFGLSMNAGSTDIQTDADTAMAGSISMNAGSIDFCSAPGAALRFTVNANITFSHNLDDAGLNHSGDTWTSDNFDGADHVIDLRLEGNAASFNLNPEGGCS
jgi:hypothetical protein